MSFTEFVTNRDQITTRKTLLKNIFMGIKFIVSVSLMVAGWSYKSAKAGNGCDGYTHPAICRTIDTIGNQECHFIGGTWSGDRPACYETSLACEDPETQPCTGCSGSTCNPGC